MTTTNAVPVDVLAVMDFHIADKAGQGRMVAQRDELIEARAAVAELIEAANDVLDFGDSENMLRLNAALARCGSAP